MHNTGGGYGNAPSSGYGGANGASYGAQTYGSAYGGPGAQPPSAQTYSGAPQASWQAPESSYSTSSSSNAYSSSPPGQQQQPFTYQQDSFGSPSPSLPQGSQYGSTSSSFAGPNYPGSSTSSGYHGSSMSSGYINPQQNPGYAAPSSYGSSFTSAQGPPSMSSPPLGPPSSSSSSSMQGFDASSSSYTPAYTGYSSSPGLGPQQPGPQTMYQQAHQPPPQPVSRDILASFDPLGAGTGASEEVSLSSIIGRLNRLAQRGVLSQGEYSALQVLTAHDARRVQNALNKLEHFDDRSDVTTIAYSYDNMTARRAAEQSKREQTAFQQRASARATAASLAEQEKQRREAALAATKAKKDLGIESDEESDTMSAAGEAFETETIVDSDEERRQDKMTASRMQARIDAENALKSAPHPCAGGFKDSIPSSFVFTGDELLGTILVRVSKKKFFRKWKPMFFRLTTTSVRLYENNAEYESGSAASLVFPLHPCMSIDKPALKRTYSMADETEHVFFTTFKENILDGISEFEMPNKYSNRRRNRRLCKFGSTVTTEISAFAHALHGVILRRRKERSLGRASANAGRYS
ncbi:Hypothetical Protein FCC1311_032042 [Hondaea fermentalgiana]|uniref:PH domain-containing protein n=1 Tax=Hondaea fermentalgiana TaxID=2315210 RepID=A0A2R5GFF5_9STRA|nr:Hypothetical Protein FCC1311_032042 [Hondaea fermentalgiana]|eukprot:GBG26981.1 Hypothetical Protein FCC1311_032042 [Hondaea fermentalgiana]